jgi:hypothetical protein
METRFTALGQSARSDSSSLTCGASKSMAARNSASNMPFCAVSHKWAGSACARDTPTRLILAIHTRQSGACGHRGATHRPATIAVGAARSHHPVVVASSELLITCTSERAATGEGYRARRTHQRSGSCRVADPGPLARVTRRHRHRSTGRGLVPKRPSRQPPHAPGCARSTQQAFPARRLGRPWRRVTTHALRRTRSSRM